MIFKRMGSRVKQSFAKVGRFITGSKKKLLSFNRKQLLLVGLGGVVAISLLTGVALKVTSTPQFCSSCHEMSPEYATWETSSHSKIACVTCHIEPGAVSLVTHKMSSLKQLYLHLTGKIPETIVMPDPIKNEVCEECHSTARKVTASGDIIIPHDKHLQQGIACVACHAGVVHGYVVERGLTAKKDDSTWTATKAETVSTFDDTKLAMEVCLNCHEQVNEGKKPWLENQGQGQTEKQRAEEQGQLKQVAANATGKLSEPAQSVTPTNISGLHPPMNCSACHTAIKTPDSHQKDDWKTTHGITASQDVTYCASCHSREKERVLVTKNTKVQDYARSNTFCADCHAKRPEGHLAGKEEWLPAHPVVIQSKGSDGCLTCHDIDKPTPQPQSPQNQLPGQALSSPNPVNCNQCHWFKNNKVN
ncbi:NapC/NirT family cytochrome c [Desulfosporosinus sp. OT]|uniref:cytochrome c3 family protein n=1 Tax=Desulfosporosinus sp. OT TaxID=913865 RepID=UPI000223AF3E|nr:NapC/NirT family cytochrome c [Desulfosporosinus sp. OT]EGW38222.1 napC/NirT cytochrome c family protein [Desulfosporosinus sp. OT]